MRTTTTLMIQMTCASKRGFFARRTRSAACLHSALTGCGERQGRCLECHAVVSTPFTIHAL